MFIARINLKLRAGQRAAFRDYAGAEGLQARTLAGCVDYSFFEDVGDPTRVLLYEEWASRKQFEAYKASPVFEAAGARLRPLLEEPPKSAYYESEDVYASCALR
jgi:quinol monooxygenase YgiN